MTQLNLGTSGIRPVWYARRSLAHAFWLLDGEELATSVCHHAALDDSWKPADVRERCRHCERALR